MSEHPTDKFEMSYSKQQQMCIDSDSVAVAVSIIGDLERELAAAEQKLEQARTYSGIEAYPCWLCTYENGKFIKYCEPHRQLAAAEAEAARLRAGLERLGSETALSYCGLVQLWRGEEKARLDFARQLLESPAEKGGDKT